MFTSTISFALGSGHARDRRVHAQVYCFDPREYKKCNNGMSATGPYRAQFVLDAIAKLRKNLAGGRLRPHSALWQAGGGALTLLRDN